MAETERRYLPSRSVLFISKAAIFFFFFGLIELKIIDV
jgi:hypothetical protein